MEVLLNLLHGLTNIATPVNLAAMVIGLVLGMLVAVLPGLTLVMGVVLALPFTYKMGVEPALILLTAMYVSGTYGGAITAILFRIPGEPMDVPLLWDGYAMTRQRRCRARARLVARRRSRWRPGLGRRDGCARRSRSRASR